MSEGEHMGEVRTRAPKKAHSRVPHLGLDVGEESIVLRETLCVGVEPCTERFVEFEECSS